MAAKQGLTVIVPTISMFHEVHSWNKENIPGYFEVYIKVSEKVRIERDPKLLYQSYQRGKNNDMPGLDLTVEVPRAPDLIIENNGSIITLPAISHLIFDKFFKSNQKHQC